jgi:hypothetical protein
MNKYAGTIESNDDDTYAMFVIFHRSKSEDDEILTDTGRTPQEQLAEELQACYNSPEAPAGQFKVLTAQDLLNLIIEPTK